MNPRKFDHDFEATRRRIERMHRVLVAAVILLALAASLGTVWLLGHPHQIGHFFGLIAAGFGVAA